MGPTRHRQGLRMCWGGGGRGDPKTQPLATELVSATELASAAGTSLEASGRAVLPPVRLEQEEVTRAPHVTFVVAR